MKQYRRTKQPEGKENVMNQALALFTNLDDPVGAAERMGVLIAKSGLVKVPSVEAGAVVALTCMAEGIHPIEFNRRYHLIQGKPTYQSHAMLAEFRANHGGKHKVIERSENRAAITLIDKEGAESTFELTWEECQNELWPYGKADKDGNKPLKDNWATPRGRENMMWARVVSEAVRTVCPEVCYGIYTPEEVIDFTDAPTSTVAAAAAQPGKENNGEVVEADYEVVPDDSQLCDTQVAMEIQSLAVQLNLTEEQLKGILAKRGVDDTTQLSVDDAAEIVKKLRDKAMAVSGN